jgi:hypothetical protein
MVYFQTKNSNLGKFKTALEWKMLLHVMPIWNILRQSGANPTIASHNARIVNFYNATGSLACFENKNISFYFEKRSGLLQRWRKFKSRRIGSWYIVYIW